MPLPETALAEQEPVAPIKSVDHRVLQIDHDRAPGGVYRGPDKGKTTGVVAPGRIHFIRHPEHHNEIVGTKIVMADAGREEMSPESLALITAKVDELRALIAQTMGVTPGQLNIHLGHRMELKQTIVAAIWDRNEGLGGGGCD